MPRKYAHDGELPLKRCTKCGAYKTLGDFNRSASTHAMPGVRREYHCRVCRALYSAQYLAANRERMAAVARDWVKENPEKLRDAARSRAYGMSGLEYRAMRDAQGGGCAVCGGLNASGRALAIDHDHACCAEIPTCGACNRGLLCSKCNTGLGSFGDDPALLLEAAAYLESHGKKA